MKTLYESILDDEGEVIGRIVEMVQWPKTIKKFLKNNKYSECSKWLNNNEVYIAGDQKYCTWEDSGIGVYYWYEGTLPLLYIGEYQENIFKIEFMDDYDRDDYTIQDRLNLYNLTQDEYNSIKDNIIKLLNAKKIKTNNKNFTWIFKL